jgi:hypothetical protein
MPIRSFGVGCGVFHKFGGELPPRRSSGLQRFPVGNDFQILAGKGRKAEVLELQFDTLDNGPGAEARRLVPRPWPLGGSGEAAKRTSESR